MQIYPHKAKINANIASIYAIINPIPFDKFSRHYQMKFFTSKIIHKYNYKCNKTIIS